MKGAHLRRAPYRPHLEFAIGLVALAVCGVGIGLVMADVLEKRQVRISTPESATTTTMINSSVIEPEMTTVMPTTTTTTPRPVGRVPAPVLKKVAAAPAPTSTTTTTEVPKTALEAAQSQVGMTGPYAEGGMWCAKFISWIAEQAKIENFQQSDSPARLHKIAMDEARIVAAPFPGYLVFIDLTGQNFANQYVSHVGIVESVNGDEFVSIEGNADNSGLVTRQTRRVGDGFVISFAEMAI
jgi:CHAP domain